MLIIAILAGTVGLLVALVVAIEVLARRRAQRRAVWHRQYYYEGGLVRSLIARWSSQPKLTYRSHRKDTDEL